MHVGQCVLVCMSVGLSNISFYTPFSKFENPQDMNSLLSSHAATINVDPDVTYVCVILLLSVSDNSSMFVRMYKSSDTLRIV